MSLGYVESCFEGPESESGAGLSLKPLLEQIRADARARGAGAGEVSGIEFPRFLRDRRRLREALAQIHKVDRGGRSASSAQSTLLRATLDYEQAAASLAPDEPARDMAQMLAWARQAGRSVHPGLQHLGERCLPFRHFVDASVVCVILLEDVGETFGGARLRPLEAAVDRLVRDYAREPRAAHWRFRARARGALSAKDRYLVALGESLALLGDTLDRLWQPVDAAQRDECDSWLSTALAEVVRSRDVSRAFNRYVTQREIAPSAADAALECEVATLDVPAFVEANRANIFMRAMFEAGIRSAVARRSRRKSAWDQEWWAVAAETRRVGAMLEGLGNMANDLATLFREWGEGFAGNFLLVQGFSSGAFSPAMVRESYEELDRHFASAERRELMVEVGKAYFASGGERAEAHLARSAPGCWKTRALLAALCRYQVIEEGVEYWRSESEGLRRKFRRGALGAFFAEDALWRRQVGFLFQYLTANALV